MNQRASIVYGRAHLAVAYAILLVTCIAGAVHAPWWAAAAGASSLALLSLIAHRVISVTHLGTGGAISEPVLITSSVLNAGVFACGTFIFGHIARWAWGL